MILQDFRPTAICCTPSYALNLAEQGRAMGVDMPSLALRVGVFGAEPWSEKMRDEIEKAMNLKAFNIYGLSEIMGPGVSMECIEARDGMHILRITFWSKPLIRKPAKCCLPERKANWFSPRSPRKPFH